MKQPKDKPFVAAQNYDPVALSPVAGERVSPEAPEQLTETLGDPLLGAAWTRHDSVKLNDARR